MATWVGVETFRRWSLSNGLLDHPNDRSSHDLPTPRGGGLVIVAISLLLYSFITYYITNDFKWHYPVAGGMVALISWLDDLYSVSFLLRLCVHAGAAAILIWGVGFPRQIYVPGLDDVLNIGNFGAIIAFVWIVWMVNAYNFMDGIDGLAGSQTILAGFAWLVYGYILGTRSIYLFAGVLAFSGVDFLIHNWSPAKVFMGDVGSAFLGFTFAALPLIAAEKSAATSATLLLAAASFVWFFLFDTIFTFVRRFVRGEKVWTAHREHFYQWLVIGGTSHSTVTLIYSAFTVLVIASVLIAGVFRGTWEFLPLFSIVSLSLILVFCSTRRKGLT
ncbi:MAG: glycosyltransferase family 4 protein [Pyrinomonadaceae bacterium]